MRATKPLTLRYRQGNPNVFSVRLNDGNGAVVPSSALAIKLELRISEAEQALASVSLTPDPNNPGRLTCALPETLDTGRYVAGLLFDYFTGSDYHKGLCYLEILPTGTLVAVPDITGLNLTITEQTQILDVSLDVPGGMDTTPAPDYANIYQLFKQ